MKRIILAASFLLVIGTTGFGQQNNTQVSPMKVYKMESTVAPEQKVEMTKEEEIAYCEGVINALDQKEAWIRSNPEELKLATENGWFVNANATREKMGARIIELKK